MANNNSLEDKNVKMLLVVVVVGLVIYLLVSYLNGNGICGNTQEGFHTEEELKALHYSLGENHHPLEAETEGEEEENLDENSLVNGVSSSLGSVADSAATVLGATVPAVPGATVPAVGGATVPAVLGAGSAAAAANGGLAANYDAVNNSTVNAPTGIPAEEFVNKEFEGFQNSGPQPSDNTSSNQQEVAQSNNANPNNLPAECYPKDVLSSGDLLPSDANSKWAQVNPNGQGSLGDKNFLTAGYHVGVNTVGQSLRNANRQLRSDPPNPQVKVSPWMQTTIEPDVNRKPFEVGA